MNSAAVIGRQLRQQNRASGSTLPVPGRPRAPSHINLGPLPTSTGAAGSAGSHHQSPTKDDAEAQGHHSSISLACIWQAVKALSSGICLMAVGMAMCVVGFLAEDLATTVTVRGNVTTTTVDRSMEYHLYNLSVAGPAIMGLGGICIVAACVFTFGVKDHHHRVVPVDEKRPSIGDTLVPILPLPPRNRVPAHRDRRRSSSVLPPPLSASAASAATQCLTVPEVCEQSSGAVWTCPEPGPSTRVPPPPTSLTLATRAVSPFNVRQKHTTAPSLSTTSSTCTNFLISPQYYENQWLPSPADYQIADPDGITVDGGSYCTTPASSTFSRSSTQSSLHLDLYLRTTTTVAFRVPQMQPRLFASMESDGLSSSDDDIHSPQDIMLHEFGSRCVRHVGTGTSPAARDEVTPLLADGDDNSPSPELVRKATQTGDKRFPLLTTADSITVNNIETSRGLNGKKMELNNIS